MDDKFEWCFNHGIKLIDPNDDISKEYFKSAEETLLVANLSKSSGSNMWLATHKYYAEYLASYALLMKFGIKSEIHSCTIEIIKLLEDYGFINFNLSEILDFDKELRVDNQYYLKDVPIDFDSVIIAELLMKVKRLIDGLTSEDVIKVRDLIKRKIYKDK